MTIIHFSLGFDSHVYKDNANLFDEIYIGAIQLLGVLERELGLTGEFKTTKERQAEYLEFLTQEIIGKKLFITESFSNDNIGVANVLLKWRDDLKFSNWSFDKGISERLDLLSTIEQSCSISVGIADRWLLVMNQLNKTSVLSIDSLVINDDYDLLPPFYQKLFRVIESKGVKISKQLTKSVNKSGSNLSKVQTAILNNELNVELDNSDNSFQIIRFDDSIIAADFLAQQLRNQAFNPVIINTNNYGLDTAFIANNSPTSGSKINKVNPHVIQLFKLASSLLFDKLNPHNLLSLLNLPLLPFSKSLANNLSKILISKAGIGNDDWDNAISYFKENIDKERSNWKVSLKSIEFYFERERVENIEKTDLIAFYRSIGSWAAKMQAIIEHDDMKLELANLSILCKSFVKTIESFTKDKYVQKDVDKTIRKIYEPISINTSNKEKGSCDIFQDPSQLYDKADNLIWFDFYNQELAASICEFLMQSELVKLEAQDGILLWSRENQVKFQLENLKKGILMAENRLVLFIAKKSNGENTKEHPLFTQLSASISNIDTFITDFSLGSQQMTDWGWEKIEAFETKEIDLPKAIDYIKLKNTNLLTKRDKESFSSINTIIQYPFDWVMNYKAKIDDKGLGSIDEIITLKGNLSHIIVQTLFQKQKDGKIDLSKVNLDDEIDILLELYVPMIASPFYLDENILEYKAFVTQLKKSFNILLEIIQNNNLEFHSYEYKVDGEIDDIFFGGSIDLLFYQGEKPFIIDLKWTFSQAKYSTILEDEKSIQLALYGKLINNKEVVVAYFLISHAKLLTTYELLKGNGIMIINNDDRNGVIDRTITRTLNSFNYRWSELKQGDVELAEEKQLTEIKYHNDTDDSYLIPLDVKDRKYKKSNYYSNYGLFKGRVK